MFTGPCTKFTLRHFAFLTVATQIIKCYCSWYYISSWSDNITIKYILTYICGFRAMIHSRPTEVKANMTHKQPPTRTQTQASSGANICSEVSLGGITSFNIQTSQYQRHWGRFSEWRRQLAIYLSQFSSVHTSRETLPSADVHGCQGHHFFAQTTHVHLTFSTTCHYSSTDAAMTHALCCKSDSMRCLLAEYCNVLPSFLSHHSTETEFWLSFEHLKSDCQNSEAVLFLTILSGTKILIKSLFKLINYNSSSSAHYKCTLVVSGRI